MTSWRMPTPLSPARRILMGASSNQKRTIRRKAAKFVVRNGELLYRKCRKVKDGEKVAKATCTYSHQYSIL